jgi:hypothetical protein
MISNVDLDEPPEVAAARGVIVNANVAEAGRTVNLRVVAAVISVGTLALIAANWLIEAR